MTYKDEAFKEELKLIQDESIKTFAIEAIQSIPDYFFEIPASSTGRYHPAYALGEGGLLRHTRAAIRIAIELLHIGWWKFSQREIDLIIVAIILHDGWKSGVEKTKFTLSEHPEIAVNELDGNVPLKNKNLISQSDFDFIKGCILSHMGRWNFNYKTNIEILPKPETNHQKFVHLCDYLASRKCLEMNFDVELSKE